MKKCINMKKCIKKLSFFGCAIIFCTLLLTKNNLFHAAAQRTATASGRVITRLGSSGMAGRVGGRVAPITTRWAGATGQMTGQQRAFSAAASSALSNQRISPPPTFSSTYATPASQTPAQQPSLYQPISRTTSVPSTVPISSAAPSSTSSIQSAQNTKRTLATPSSNLASNSNLESDSESYLGSYQPFTADINDPKITPEERIERLIKTSDSLKEYADHLATVIDTPEVTVEDTRIYKNIINEITDPKLLESALAQANQLEKNNFSENKSPENASSKGLELCEKLKTFIGPLRNKLKTTIMADKKQITAIEQEIKKLPFLARAFMIWRPHPTLNEVQERLKRNQLRSTILKSIFESALVICRDYTALAQVPIKVNAGNALGQLN